MEQRCGAIQKHRDFPKIRNRQIIRKYIAVVRCRRDHCGINRVIIKRHAGIDIENLLHLRALVPCDGGGQAVTVEVIAARAATGLGRRPGHRRGDINIKIQRGNCGIRLVIDPAEHRSCAGNGLAFPNAGTADILRETVTVGQRDRHLRGIDGIKTESRLLKRRAVRIVPHDLRRPVLAVRHGGLRGGLCHRCGHGKVHAGNKRAGIERHRTVRARAARGGNFPVPQRHGHVRKRRACGVRSGHGHGFQRCRCHVCGQRNAHGGRRSRSQCARNGCIVRAARHGDGISPRASRAGFIGQRKDHGTVRVRSGCCSRREIRRVERDGHSLRRLSVRVLHGHGQRRTVRSGDALRQTDHNARAVHRDRCSRNGVPAAVRNGDGISRFRSGFAPADAAVFIQIWYRGVHRADAIRVRHAEIHHIICVQNTGNTVWKVRVNEGDFRPLQAAGNIIIVHQLHTDGPGVRQRAGHCLRFLVLHRQGDSQRPIAGERHQRADDAGVRTGRAFPQENIIRIRPKGNRLVSRSIRIPGRVRLLQRVGAAQGYGGTAP